MKSKLVEINLHGSAFDGLKKQFKLAVKSCSEALHAVNVLTKNAFYARLLDNDKKNIKYVVLINKNPCLFPEKPDEKKIETILNSELVAKYESLSTIDIVPLIEGADFMSADPLLAAIAGSDIANVVTGALLIIGGFALLAFTGGASAIMIFAGLGLLAIGIINLLSTPPKLDDFKGPARRGSYLFDGPQNAVGEGGPVPLVYGQLIVGSQTIATTYAISDRDAGQIITT